MILHTQVRKNSHLYGCFFSYQGMQVLLDTGKKSVLDNFGGVYYNVFERGDEMTVGEKIQKYRKEKGLSQEELGQMLLVSRQTVSLWEKDKTLPTVDNLKRLKEIFGISVDDILEEGHDDGYKDAPLEKYRFNFDSKEIREIIGLNLRLLISRAMVLAIIVFASWMLYVGMDNADYTMAMAVTVIVGIRYALFIRSFIFMRRKTLFKLSSQTCEYDVYDDYFNVTVIR